MPFTKPPSIKQLKNEKAMKVYAASLCGFIIVAIAARRLCMQCNKTLRPSTLNTGWLAVISRTILRIFWASERRISFKWLGRTSLGLLALMGVFLAINVALSFNIIAGYQVNFFASRFGWLAVGNMALCVAFALKTSPLARLAVDVSSAQLTRLHILAGYSSAFLVFLHAIFYTVHFCRQGRWRVLIEIDNVFGVIAAAAMVVSLMGILRSRNYELFYASHVVSFVILVLLTGLHRPDWAKNVPKAMAFTAVIWVADRLRRMATMSYHLVNNQIAIHPLAGGATRLLLKKPGAKTALPGSYCYLWIPQICFYQTHPFTIVENGPAGLELVVKSYGGFTKELYEFAVRRPGCMSRASIDGPYGTLPDTALYEKLIFVAGGSGAAFTFGLVNRILNHCHQIPSQAIDFIWAVRYKEQLSWFKSHLLRLTAPDSPVNVTIYVTRKEFYSGAHYGTCAEVDGDEIGVCNEDRLPREDLNAYECVSQNSDSETLLSGVADGADGRKVTFLYERMDTDMVIRKAMETALGDERALVAACGPDMLLQDVCDSVDDYRSRHSCRIDVHCEEFSA